LEEINSRLFAQAHEIAAVYRTNPSLKSIILIGSVARGHADLHSDVDLILLYQKRPSWAELQAAYERLQGTRRRVIKSEANKTRRRIRETFYVGDILYDLKHSRVRAMERRISRVVGHRDSAPLRFEAQAWGFPQRDSDTADMFRAQADTADILEGIPLYGCEFFQQLRAKAAKYPDELARAMVKGHLRFRPKWQVRTRIAERDDLLLLYEDFIETERNIIGVLLGLNRVYHPVSFKRIDSLVTKLSIAPNDLSVRLKRIFLDDPDHAVEQLEKLIEETFALVASHMPDLDVRAAWNKFHEPKLP
jgi:predicted nucleotidyltransferase